MSRHTDFITYAVVCLTMRRNDLVLATGSGFVYRKSDKYYLVTAWHNLTGRNSETLELLGKTGAVPNNIIVDFGFLHIMPDESVGFFRLPIVIDLHNDDVPIYTIHKQSWPRIDVAVIAIDPDADFNVEIHVSDGTMRQYKTPLRYRQNDDSFISISYLDRSKEVHYVDEDDDFEIEHTVGDDLFLIGYPAKIMDHYINPIWKRASFASRFASNWMGQKLFIVDSASRKGMSGCVALYYSKSGVVPVRPGSSLSIGKEISIIHGVYAGRYGDSEFEAQVGRVWKMDIVDEIIEDGRETVSSEEIEIPVSEVVKFIENEWPEQAEAASDYVARKPPLDYYANFILDGIDGRAGSNFVKDKIVEIAQKKIDDQT